MGKRQHLEAMTVTLRIRTAAAVEGVEPFIRQAVRECDNGSWIIDEVKIVPESQEQDFGGGTAGYSDDE